MATVVNAEVGTIGLIQEQPDGTIVQLGLNEEQSSALQLFVAALSREKPLLRLPEKYNLKIANKF